MMASGVTTRDAQEGIRRFLEKRQPKFTERERGRLADR